MITKAELRSEIYDVIETAKLYTAAMRDAEVAHRAMELAPSPRTRKAFLRAQTELHQAGLASNEADRRYRTKLAELYGWKANMKTPMTIYTDTQSAFDFMVNHLLRQRARSLDPDGMGCVYRSYRGLKCPVGAMIPDEVYDPRMEGLNIMDLLDQFPAVAELHQYVDSDLLLAVQRLHDTIHPDQWKDGLRDIAVRYGLTYRTTVK